MRGKDLHEDHEHSTHRLPVRTREDLSGAAIQPQGCIACVNYLLNSSEHSAKQAKRQKVKDLERERIRGKLFTKYS